MNKEEKVIRLKHLHGSFAKILADFLKEDRFSEDDPFEDALLSLCGDYSREIVRSQADKMYESIYWMAKEGEWIQLNSLLRILPNIIKEHMESNTDQQCTDHKILLRFTEQCIAFMNMSENDRQNALDYILKERSNV